MGKDEMFVLAYVVGGMASVGLMAFLATKGYDFEPDGFMFAFALWFLFVPLAIGVIIGERRNG